ncbi:hypothetical protein [Hydrogenophaga defluvii]|uniref:ArsR family transcriptional regulator n=1 Tax=Hydrogenophaga defluvii TaxID=249410 RepID=A0ABW2S8G4_9BURK
MNEDHIRLQAARSRREFIRWLLLLAANINRPTVSLLRFLVQVVQAEYPDATELEVRRELDYLESRELMKVFTDPLGQLSADLTRHGIDVAEYTVAVEPGIMRPPKV